jgi:hypothetical protein
MFTIIGGQFNQHLAAVDATSGAASGWNPSPNDIALTLAASGGRIYAGGQFALAGGVTRNYLAALDGTSGAATAWDPEPNQVVGLMAAVGSTVYVSGYFGQIGGQTRVGLAAIDASSGLALPSWSADVNGPLSALIPAGGYLYLAGNFTTVGGQSRLRLGRINAASGALSNWTPGGGLTSAVALGNVLYAAYPVGSFIPSGVIGAYDTTTGNPTAFSATTNLPIYSIAASPTTVYIGGAFSSVNGVPHSCLAALASSNGATLPFSADANSNVSQLVVDGNTLFAGGSFSQIAGRPVGGLAALDATSGAFEPGDLAFGGTPSVMLRTSGRLDVGGSIGSAVGYSAANLASILDSAPLAAPPAGTPLDLALRSWPNPARGRIAIRYALPTAARVALEVYDVAGRRVASLESGPRAAGEHQTAWDAGAASRGAGIYFLRLQAGSEVLTRRVAVMK